MDVFTNAIMAANKPEVIKNKETSLGWFKTLTGGRRDAAASIAYQDRQRAEQMKFQEDMSNTAYQRAVKDMQAAGLNPALAYQQGGAQSASGSAPQKSDHGEGAGALISAALHLVGAIATKGMSLANTSMQLKKVTAAKTMWQNMKW